MQQLNNPKQSVKQREPNMMSPVRSLHKDLRSSHYKQSNAIKQNAMKKDHQALKSPESSYSQQTTKRTLMPSLEKIIASPKYFNKKSQKNQQQDNYHKQSNNTMHIKKLLQQQQKAVMKQQHQSHMVAPQQIDMILTENEQLKREINMLKSLINHVVPQEILQKPIENITDILSDASFMTGSHAESQMPQHRRGHRGGASSEDLYYIVDSKRQKKSTMQVPKVVCHDTSRGETTYTIDMLEEFENTNYESNLLRKVQDDIAQQPLKNSTNIMKGSQLEPSLTFGITNRNQPCYLERPFKHQSTIINQDFHSLVQQNIQHQTKTIVDTVQGANQFFMSQAELMSPTFQPFVEQTRHQQKFSHDINETGGQQLLNSYLTYSAYGHSFHSDENPINSAQKQQVLSSFRQYDILPDEAMNRMCTEEQIHQLDRLKQKKFISQYPKPIENVSQNTFSSLSYTHNVSCKDPNEDLLLDQHILNRKHSLLELDNQNEMQFSPKTLVGDNDCEPQQISLNDTKSDQPEDSIDYQDDIVLQKSYIQGRQERNSDNNDQSYCSIVQAEQNDFINDINEYESEVVVGNQRYALERLDDLRVDSAEVVEYPHEQNQTDPSSDSNKQVIIQSNRQIQFQGQFNKTSEYFSNIEQEIARVDQLQVPPVEQIHEQTQESLVQQVREVVSSLSRTDGTTLLMHNEQRHRENSEIKSGLHPKVFYTVSESIQQSFSEPEEQGAEPEKMVAITKRSSIEDIKQNDHQNIGQQNQVLEQQVESAAFKHFCNESNVTFIDLIEKRTYKTKSLTRNMTPQSYLSPNQKRDQDTLINTKRARSNQRKKSLIQEDLDVCTTVRNSQLGLRREDSLDVLKWSLQEEKEKNLVELNKYLIKRTSEVEPPKNYQEDLLQSVFGKQKNLSPSKIVGGKQSVNEDAPISSLNTEGLRSMIECQNVIELHIVLETSQTISSRRVTEQKFVDSKRQSYEAQMREPYKEELLNKQSQEEVLALEYSFQGAPKFQTEISNEASRTQIEQEIKNILTQSPSKGRFAKLADSIRSIRNNKQTISHFELQKPIGQLAQEEKKETDVQVQITDNHQEFQNLRDEVKNHCFDPESSTETPRPLESLVVPEQQSCIKPIPLPEYPVQQIDEKNHETLDGGRTSRRRDDSMLETTRNGSQRRSSNKRSIRDKLQQAHKVLCSYQSQDQIHSDAPLQCPKKPQQMSQQLKTVGSLPSNLSPVIIDQSSQSARLIAAEVERMAPSQAFESSIQNQSDLSLNRQQFSINSSQPYLQQTQQYYLNQIAPQVWNQSQSQSSEDQIVVCAQTQTQSAPKLEIIEEEPRTQRGSILDSVVIQLNQEEEPATVQQSSFKSRRESLILCQQPIPLPESSKPIQVYSQVTSKDQETKELFDLIFKEIKRSNIIEEQPSQEEIESNDSFKRDLPVVMKNSLKVGSNDSSFVSIKNIETQGTEVIVSNYNQKRCSSTRPSTMTHTISSLQKQVNLQLKKKSPGRSPSPTKSSPPSKRQSTDPKFKTLEAPRTENIVARPTPPGNSKKEFRTLSSARQQKQFETIYKTSVEKQTIVLYQDVESNRKNINMPLQKTSQRPPINSHRVLANVNSNINQSPSKTVEKLRQRSVERQQQIEKSIQRSMKRLEKMQHIKERRELLSKAKMDQKIEKFNRKYSVTQTMKAEVYLNEVQTHGSTTKQQFATLVDQITSPTNQCQSKRASDASSIKKSQRQSLEPGSKEQTPAKQPFVYKKAPGLFENSIKEIQLQTAFHKRRQDMKAVNASTNVSNSTIDPTASTMPNKSKDATSSNTARAKQAPSQSFRATKIQVPKSSRPVHSATHHTHDSRTNDSMNSSLNNSQIKSKMGITISVTQRRNLKQFINSQQSDSSRKDSEPIISSINIPVGKQSKPASSLASTAKFGNLIRDLIELSPVMMDQTDSEKNSIVEQNPEEATQPSQQKGTASVQETSRSAYPSTQRDSLMIKKLAEDHKKRVSLRGRFLK